LRKDDFKFENFSALRAPSEAINKNMSNIF